MANSSIPSGRMEKIITNAIQAALIAVGIWLANTASQLTVTVAALQERIKSLEEIPSKVNSMELSQEDIKERVIHLEDYNNHRNQSKN